jgi:hypothetical protein
MSTMSDTDWRARAEAAEARVAELAAERARLWEELNRLRAERQDVDYYQRLATRMETSLSWRITAPLRLGKMLAIKVRRKLDERG